MSRVPDSVAGLTLVPRVAQLQLIMSDQTAHASSALHLGAFSISLAVKDLARSREFYEKLGFSVFGGNDEHHFLIMKSGSHLIGLFQGMFEKNILTFNPGWDQDAQNLKGFTDVRQLQARLDEAGVQIVQRADAEASGPASFTVIDPDGNLILVDQHVDAPSS